MFSDEIVDTYFPKYFVNVSLERKKKIWNSWFRKTFTKKFRRFWQYLSCLYSRHERKV